MYKQRKTVSGFEFSRRSTCSGDIFQLHVRDFTGRRFLRSGSEWRQDVRLKKHTELQEVATDTSDMYGRSKLQDLLYRVTINDSFVFKTLFLLCRHFLKALNSCCQLLHTLQTW
jgi:hypothetical protein